MSREAYESKHKMEDGELESFTLSLAIVDTLPVLFFSGSALVISRLFGSSLFLLGAILCILAGLGKVLWKLILAISHKSYLILNRQLRVLMPAGFLLILFSLLVDHARIQLSAIWVGFCSMPSLFFFILGILGLVLMTVFAFRLDGSNVKNNWLEQITNTVAQAALFFGLLFLI